MRSTVQLTRRMRLTVKRQSTKGFPSLLKRLTLSLITPGSYQWNTLHAVTLTLVTDTLLALTPDALVRTDARPPALLACAPLTLVLADARPPALLALS